MVRLEMVIKFNDSYLYVGQGAVGKDRQVKKSLLVEAQKDRQVKHY